MKALKAYKYRLVPNDNQIVLINQHFGCVRFTKNWAIAIRSRYYKMFGKSVSARRVQDHLVKKKKLAKYTWLNEVNSQSLLAALKDIDTAFSNFLRKSAGYPKFKKKYSLHQSFHAPQHVQVLGNKVKLPKIGLVRLIKHRAMAQGKIKTCTISRNATGKYFISILLEQEVSDIIPSTIKEEETIGADLGIRKYLTLSDGVQIYNPRYLQRSLKDLAVAQRKLARSKKSSKSRAKKRYVVAKRHERVANSRKNFLHKLSHHFAVKNQATTYVGENLMIKEMAKAPYLSRLIYDAAWGMFDTFMTYKMKENGKNYLKVDPKHTSQVCRKCGYEHTKLKLSDTTFVCPSCSHTEDRDVHAAKNIKALGLKQYLNRQVLPAV